jgi:hypothetical protein
LLFSIYHFWAGFCLLTEVNEELEALMSQLSEKVDAKRFLKVAEIWKRAIPKAGWAIMCALSAKHC